MTESQFIKKYNELWKKALRLPKNDCVRILKLAYKLKQDYYKKVRK
jgi:hypothetical protein